MRACEKIYPALNGPFTRLIKSRVVHAPGMLGMFSPPPRVSVPDMHHVTCVTHVPWCMPGSLTSGFLISRWRGKRSRHSRRMRNPQCCVSGKWPMALCVQSETHHHETYHYGRHWSNRIFVSEKYHGNLLYVPANPSRSWQLIHQVHSGMMRHLDNGQSVRYGRLHLNAGRCLSFNAVKYYIFYDKIN